MSLKIGHQKSVPENKNLFAVLVLSDPPSLCKAEDWYWNKIAGVPFLLRNILSIQEGGVKHLILFAGKNAPAIEELCRRARNDSRVRLKLECVSGPENLVESVKADSGALFLDGSVLNSITGIEATLQSGLADKNQGTSRVLSMDPENLKSLVERIEDQGLLACLGKINFQDLRPPTEFPQDGALKVVFAEADENWRLARPEDFDTVSDRLIKTSGLSNDSFMDRNFTRHVSRQLTRQIIKTPITPNQLTIVSLAVGLEAAGCFLFGGYGMSILGAGLLLLSACIDCCDGEIARLKFMESPVGKRLDIFCDNLVHVAVFFAIGMGLYGSTNKSLFILLGSLAVMGSLISFILLSPKIVNSKSQSSHFQLSVNREKDFVDHLANRDFTYFLFIMAMIGSLDIFIGLTAVGANALAGYLLYNKFKTAS